MSHLKDRFYFEIICVKVDKLDRVLTEKDPNHICSNRAKIERVKPPKFIVSYRKTELPYFKDYTQ